MIIRAGRLLVARDIGAALVLPAGRVRRDRRGRRGLRGQPLLQPDGSTLVAFAAVLIGVVVATIVVLTTRRAAPRLGASA
ncbi:MAG: hypothetical protein ACRDRM_00485 [Pseudonocardiaceae bacterium]